MLNGLLIVIAVLVVLVVILAAIMSTRPSEFRVKRSATIAAPPGVVFAQVNDFHKWEAWSPWAKRDPSMKQTYEGAAAGTGAVYSWAGNKNVGEGRMTITDTRPNEWIAIQIEFLKPFAATNTAKFTFKPEGDRTEVTWSMHGKNNFMAKAFGLFMNMDKMIGGDFEAGLKEMKTISEAAVKA